MRRMKEPQKWSNPVYASFFYYVLLMVRTCDRQIKAKSFCSIKVPVTEKWKEVFRSWEDRTEETKTRTSGQLLQDKIIHTQHACLLTTEKADRKGQLWGQFLPYQPLVVQWPPTLTISFIREEMFNYSRKYKDSFFMKISQHRWESSLWPVFIKTFGPAKGF